MIKFNLNINKLEKELMDKLEAGIEKSTDLLKQNIDSITPENTKTLLWNNKSEVSVEKGKVIGKVSNDTPYAIYVEYWVEWKAYNYHKPKGTVAYTWVGNRTFARGIDMTKKQALQLLKKFLW